MSKSDPPPAWKKKGKFQGKLYYEILDKDSAQTFLADFEKLDKSKNKTVSVRQITQKKIENAESWYEAQLVFDTVTADYFKKMHYLHLEQTTVLMERYDKTMNQWLESTYRAFSGRTQSWWDFIRPDFFTIFGHAINGLARMHSFQVYHGNIREGVCVHHNQGYLFNRRWEHSNLSVSANLKKDLDDMCDLVVKVVTYADRQANRATTIPTEVQSLLTQQLSRSDENEDARWSRDPAIFWSIPKRINFLEKLYTIFYGYRDTRNLRLAAAPYFKSDWKTNIIENTPLYNVMLYGPSGTAAYGDTLSQIRLWRNALVHLRESLPTLQATPTYIYGLVNNQLPCFENAVACVNDIMKTGRYYKKNWLKNTLDLLFVKSDL